MPQGTTEETFDLEAGDTRKLDAVDVSQVTAPEQPELGRYDKEKAADDARRTIAFWLLALLILTVIAAMIAVSIVNSQPLDSGTANIQASDAKADAERLVTVLNIVFGPVVTLLGTATGFYFGQQARIGSSG